MKARDIANSSILTAIAIILGIVEGFIPSIGIPGVKLGLANIAIMVTLYGYGWYYALIVNLLRIFAVAFLRGTIFQMGFFMSLAGGLLSLGVMIVLKTFISKLHIITISVIGSIFHVSGQILIAIIFTSTPGIIYYLPFLALASVITGILVGLTTKQCLRIPFFKKEDSKK